MACDLTCDQMFKRDILRFSFFSLSLLYTHNQVSSKFAAVAAARSFSFNLRLTHFSIACMTSIAIFLICMTYTKKIFSKLIACLLSFNVYFFISHAYQRDLIERNFSPWNLVFIHMHLDENENQYHPCMSVAISLELMERMIRGGINDTAQHRLP